MAVVFLSSTFVDLRAHRQKVIEAIDRLVHIGYDVEWRAMEAFPASFRTKSLAIALDMLRDSDIYIGALGPRYGTIPPDNHKSFTEIEYDEALRRDMPRGLFLMDELTQEWTALGRDADDSKWSKLAKLRDRFATDYNPNYFDSPGDLGMKVAIALIPELEAEKRAAFADAASTLYAEPAKPRGSMKLIAQASTILGDGSEKSTITAFVTDPDANGIDDEPVLWSVIGPGYLDPITTQTKYGAASTVFTPIRSGLGAAYVYCWSLRLGLSASVRINLASARTPGVVPIA